MDAEQSIAEEDSLDAVLCVSGSRLIQSGFMVTHCKEKTVIFVNAGGGSGTKREGNVEIEVDADRGFQGGDVLRTDEILTDGGDMSFIYRSARFGNFCYRFSNLSPGEYLVDLHFAEIVNTNGPKGMRVFNVFVQEEMVLCELDIYSIVGANKPLQVVDVGIEVGKDGIIVMRFEGVVGTPMVSGIRIKQAAGKAASQVKRECVVCNNCAAEIKMSPSQNKAMRMKSLMKSEKKIEELKAQCQLKADECYEAWMSLTAANRQLEELRMELDNRFFQNMCLDQIVEKQTAKLRYISSQYERDKRVWAAAINVLEKKLEMMKVEHSWLSREAHECASSIPKLDDMIFAVQALVARYGDITLKFNEEQVKRKKLYNQLQETKGNIRVLCRCRPFTKQEESAGHKMVLDFNAAKDGDLGILTSSSNKKNFKFDRVYTPKDDQVDVFEDASPMVTSVLDGYNVCIFAYGQTGTGKTFTMEGTNENRGVNYRTLQNLFKIAEERKETVMYDIFVSVLEIYNEQIRDLLALSPTAKRLEIKQVSEGVHHVPGTVEAKVENIKEVWDVLQAGSQVRAVGSNNVNDHSSSMICTLVKAKNLVNGECTKSKLWLVDLAGSERLGKTEVQGERLKEAQNINRSLSALADVISALATKSSHIPYRNSKLTQLLQDALGGDSKTLMFVQISPSDHDLSETLSSLNFATRVRGVDLGLAKKQIDLGELQKLKMVIDKTKQELGSKDDTIHKLEEDLHNLESKAKSKDQLCKNQQETIIKLESQLASTSESCRQLEKQLLLIKEGMKEKEHICSNFQHKVNELEKKLKERDQVGPMSLQHKAKELENRMKERTKEFELHSRMLQHKIKELESKLAWERDNAEARLLQQKVKVLEEKLTGHKKQLEYTPKLESAEKLGVTPVGGTASRAENICHPVDPQRSVNSSNRINQGSILLKGADSLREIRRKRDIQIKGAENNFLLSTPLLEKKIWSAESDKGRHLDPSRGLARITRNAKQASTALKTHSSVNNRISKDQAPGIKEGNDKLKIWLR